MNFDEFKNKVDSKCRELNKELYIFDDNLHGKGVRDRILILTSWMPRYSELYDMAKLRSSVQKRKIEEAESIAMKKLVETPEGSEVPATLKKFYVDTCEIQLDGEKTTVAEEKKKFEYLLYAVNRFQSMVEDIKLGILSYQSALNFDRDEMKQLSYTS